MTLTINDDIVKKYNLSLEEFFILYLSSKEVDFESVAKSLIDKGIADRNLYNNHSVVVSNNTKEIISSILIDSDNKVLDKEQDFIDVATEMRELFPKGRKAGTTYMWRDSIGVIAKKLKTLVVKFDFHFTKEQALDATKRYIESFNGDYRYMQLLKYFILKTDKDGEIRSDFMSLIENEDEETQSVREWMTEMR